MATVISYALSTFLLNACNSATREVFFMQLCSLVFRKSEPFVS